MTLAARTRATFLTGAAAGVALAFCLGGVW